MDTVFVIIFICLLSNVMSINYQGSHKLRSVKCSREYVEAHNKAVKTNPCAPRDTFVDIASMKFNGSKIPFTVKIKQCGGSDCTYPYGCYPTSWRPIKLPIIAYEPLSEHLRQCYTVTLQEHATCGCRCQYMADQCNDRQVHNPDHCGCICSEEESCTNSMEWNDETCECVCNKIETCSTGASWVPELCKCQKITTQEDEGDYDDDEK